MASNGMLARYKKRKAPPNGWEEVSTVMEALEDEMKRAIAAPHEGKRKTESLWPVHQINWQRTRYLYDMFYTYERIPRKVLDYCVAEKLADANLMAKWKKPGYDRLCCTHAINPRNHNFGTVSICRVPKKDLEPGRIVVDVTCGCLGCASGEGGFRNIFGNKFGQSLASIQHAREARAEQAASLAASVVEAMDGSSESPAPISTGDDVVDEAVASAVADFGEEGDADGAAEAAADAVLAAFPTVWAEPGEEEEEDTAAVLAAQGSNVEDGPSAEDMAAMAAAMGGGAETAAAEDDAAPPPSAKRPRTEA